MIWARIAIGALLTMGALAAARAQGRGPSGPPYRPPAGAKDLRAVLFNWTWYMGMLRGLDDQQLVVSLEYQGKGVILHAHEVSHRQQLPDFG
jgi:hypothetical protein